MTSLSVCCLPATVNAIVIRAVASSRVLVTPSPVMGMCLPAASTVARNLTSADPALRVASAALATGSRPPLSLPPHADTPSAAAASRTGERIRSDRMTRVYPLIAPVLLAAFPLGVHGDPRDARGRALDLRRASFEQRGSQVYLRLRTQEPWSAGHLGPDALCVRLVGEHSTARICVGSDGAGRPALFAGPRRLRAVVVRRD